METSKEKVIKVLLIGNSGVGKSSILCQYGNEYFAGVYRPTIGLDFISKKLKIDGLMVTIQVWDAALQECRLNAVSRIYKMFDCGIIVYDVTDPESFEKLSFWKNDFLSKRTPSDVKTFPFIVLGNKIDKEYYRKVPPEEAQAWCQENGDIQYFEVSAKDNTMIEEAFYTAAQFPVSEKPNVERNNNDRIVILPTKPEIKYKSTCGI